MLAASNIPWELDMALLRRLEKRVLVPLPDASARFVMLQKLLLSAVPSPSLPALPPPPRAPGGVGGARGAGAADGVGGAGGAGAAGGAGGAGGDESGGDGLPAALAAATEDTEAAAAAAGAAAAAAALVAVNKVAPHPVAPGVDLAEVARRTEGFSGSDIRLLAKEVAMKPVRRMMATLEALERDPTRSRYPGGGAASPEEVDAERRKDPISSSDMAQALEVTRPSAQQFVSKYVEWERDFGAT